MNEKEEGREVKEVEEGDREESQRKGIVRNKLQWLSCIQVPKAASPLHEEGKEEE